MSSRRRPGPRIVFRPRFPYVPNAGCAKAEVLRYCEKALSAVYGLERTRSARWSPVPVKALSVPGTTVRKPPDWSLRMPEIFQPVPMTRSAVLENFGVSYTADVLTLCRRSWSQFPRFNLRRSATCCPLFWNCGVDPLSSMQCDQV